MSDARARCRASDGDLMALFAGGDAAAARELMTLYAPRLLRMAIHMLGNESEAEEVTQEAMLRLWLAAPDWQRDRATVSTWLWTVTSNLCTDVLRRRRGVPFDDIPEPLDERPAACESMMEKDRAEALKNALAGLPERQRLAVVFRHLEEMSNPQIAKIMGASVEAVESLIARGMKELRARLLAKKESLEWK